MATLQRLSDGLRQRIASRCLLGRSAGCTVRLEEPYASGEHARLTWMGSSWELRDLGSRNGTFVDGRRLEPGVAAPLVVGALVGFGEATGGWKFVEAGAPQLMAIDQKTQRAVVAEGDYLVLPDEEHPRVSIHPAADGVGWVLEDADGQTSPVDDQQVVVLDASSYRLELPAAAEETPLYAVARTLANLSLRLSVSQDEETVVVTTILHGVESDLEPREHGYLLLTLARAYQADTDAGVAVAERGWRTVDQLCDMLKVGRNMIDVAIHRARQQLARANIDSASGIVESRRGARRFGVSRFEIARLEKA